VLGKLKAAMKTPSSGPSFLIGHVTRTTSHVPRTHRWAGAINAGATRGIFLALKTLNKPGITQTRTFIVESSTFWRTRLRCGRRTFMYRSLRYGCRIKMA
jgi:hypothetical protein